MASSGPTNGAPPPRPQLPRVRPYKDYLTPSLHRSFTNAALTTLAICWFEAYLLSNFSIFWSWFPLGINGIRTGLLFITCLTIFLLRLTNLHLGRVTYKTPFENFWRTILSRRAAFAVLWYYMSAFLFSETYIFSTSRKAGLDWIDMGRSYERARLNERAVIFRTLFAMLAVCQAGVHLYLDYDALVFAHTPRPSVGKPEPILQWLARLSQSRQMQQAAMRQILPGVELVAGVAILGPLAYFLVLRQSAWELCYSIASSFFTLAKSSQPPGLENATALFGRFLWSSTLLVTLWQVTNFTFSFYASQEPLKKDRPLTSDSKYPNGSLANGLRAKKPLPHSMALWELQIIAERFEDRRRSIYSDFEKPASTIWTDIVSVTLAEVEWICKAIAASQAPPPAAQPATTDANAALPPKARLAQPLRTDQPVFSNPPRPASALDGLANGVESLAKSIGQSRQNNPVANKARLLLESSTQAAASTTHISQMSNAYLVAILKSPIGYPFRATLRRRVNAIVFGSPYSGAADMHHAVQAISRLVVCSLNEDNFGQVQKDIARILRTLIKATQDVQQLVATLQPHWTDVYFDERRQVPEVDELLATLKEAIGAIIMSFGEYSHALKFSPAELRAAKELVGKNQEMTKR